MQDEFFDMRFCGTRGSQTFATTTRPKPNGKQSSSGDAQYDCPKDYTPCSPSTSKGNTVCIKKTADKTKDCPFTLMKFVTVSDARTYSNSTDYKVYEVNDDYSFVVSKTKGDNLPLTSFKVERQPCLDPKDHSLAPGQRFYPLERDRHIHDCSIVPQYGEKYDKRYTDLGIKISEYEVQKESKVLKKLEELPMFDNYSSEGEKQRIEYSFWSRPTISWKLSCDDKHPRNSVIHAANIEADKSDLHESTIIILLGISFGAGVLFSFGFLVAFCAGCCKRSEFSGMRICGVVCLTIQLVLLTVSMVLINGQRGELRERKDAMEDLEFVNGCGDEYMNIPTHFVPEIKEANSKAMFAVILGGVQLALSMVLCMSCIIGGGSSDHDDSSDDEKDWPGNPNHDNEDNEDEPLLV